MRSASASRLTSFQIFQIRVLFAVMTAAFVLTAWHWEVSTEEAGEVTASRNHKSFNSIRSGSIVGLPQIFKKRGDKWAWPDVSAPLATFTVINTDDSGAGSLRQAILDANASAGLDSIDFNIPGGGLKTIVPLSPLPVITGPVDINGYSQPGTAANTDPTGGFNGLLLIELNGQSAGATPGLSISGGGSTIRGLIINRFQDVGIRIQSNGGNTISGNYIGTNQAGDTRLPNGGAGIFIEGVSNNIIGGTTAASRNLLSGNNFHGVEIINPGATNNQVKGNLIGTNAAGNAALSPGSVTGVWVRDGAGTTTIGGTTAADRNIISGNGNFGIWFRNSSGNVVQGNYVGTDVTGTVAVPNTLRAFTIGEGSSNNTIGGSANGARNVVSGNLDTAFRFFDPGTTGNVVRGNFIGTAANGTSPLGNSGSGFDFRNSPASGNTIGGTGPNEGNIIAFNNGDGVRMSAGNANAILGNSIHSNNLLGIDLGGDGVTANDAGDGDSGPNNLQNFPVFTSAVTGASSTTVEGSINSAPSTTYRIELFSNDSCDPSGHGEGQAFSRAFDAVTTASGTGTFSSSSLTMVPVGKFITATATDPSGNTSEFSQCIQVTAASPSPSPSPTGCSTVVTVTADLGAGSLREAINCSNTTAGVQTISFAIPGGGLHTISPASALPTITDAVVIDGTTQGALVTPLIELNGANAGAAVGLTITAGGSTVKGLAINRFSLDGINILTNGGNTVQGNFIGTDPSGTVDLGNGRWGVLIDFSANNTIGGTAPGARNVISGNNDDGIVIAHNGSNGNVVQGNFIGTDVTGTVGLGNSDDGIVIVDGAQSNTIGGTTAAARNIISGNGDNGVFIVGSGVTGNLVQGNFIGTDVNGTADLGNAGDGVEVSNASGNTVGGTASGARNVISGNNDDGVVLIGGGSMNNLVQGNFIGTDVNGTADLGNSDAGVNIDNASNNTVGGTTVAARNILSGNDDDGIQLFGSGATMNRVQGNYIGTNVNGTVALANGEDGVFIFSGANNNTVGGTDAGAGNVISGNTQHGIFVTGATAANNQISGNLVGRNSANSGPLGNGGHGMLFLGSGPNIIGGGFNPNNANTIAHNGGDGVAVVFAGGVSIKKGIISNSIFSNGGLGIDLEDDGVTPNDPCDADTGANTLQNYPVLTSAVVSGGNTTITGTLNSTPNTSFYIEFFASAAADPSGFGEGQTYLGALEMVTTAGDCNASFTAILPIVPPAGQMIITSTATDNAELANTSEFSRAITATSDTAPSPSPTPTATPSPSPTVSPTPTRTPSNLRVENASTVPGNQVSVPFVLMAQGDERIVTFRLNYDEALLDVVGVNCGAASGANCILQFNAANGVLDVTVSKAAGTYFPGQQEVVTVLFSTGPTAQSQTPLTFTSAGTFDSSGNPLQTTFTNGLIMFTPAPPPTATPTPTPTPVPTPPFEGDVNRAVPGTPGLGDGILDGFDVVWAAIFLKGDHCPTVSPNERQRLDVAELDTGGDGFLNGNDQSAIGFLVANQLFVGVAGPVNPIGICVPSTTQADEAPVDAFAADAQGTIRVINGFGFINGTATVQIEVDSHGGAAATQFTLNYDPEVLTITGLNSGTDSNPNIAAEPDAMAGTKIIVAAQTPGQIGVVVNHDGANDGTLLGEGTRRIVNVTFQIASDAALGSYPVTFSDAVFTGTSISPRGTAMPFTSKENGFMTVLGPAAATVSITGRVLTPESKGLRNAQVTLTDSDGTQRTATTSSLGYYRFEAVAPGRSYSIAASSKRYRFTTRNIEPTTNLAEVDFTAQE